MSVEEEDDGDVGNLPLLGCVADRPGDGHAAHAPHLQVDEDRVGELGGDPLGHLAGVFHEVDVVAGFAEGGEHLVADPGCVGDEQQSRHRPRTVVGVQTSSGGEPASGAS